MKLDDLTSIAKKNGWHLLTHCPLCNHSEFTPLFCGRGHCVLCKCSGCNITFLNPRPNNASYRPGWLRDHYLPNSIQRGYFSKDLEPNLSVIYSNYRKIVDMTALLSPKQVVDIGCGIGLSMLALKYKKISSVGVDVDAEFLTFAKSLGLEVRSHDITAGPIDKKVDVATLNSVLEHISEPITFLKDIRQNILSPGGALVITVPNLQSLEFLRDGEKWRMITGGHLWYFAEDSLRTVAERAGYSVERIYREKRIPSGMSAFHTYVHDILETDKNTSGGIGMVLRT